MRIGFAISAVLVLAACGVEYNPSFARVKMADAADGYGSFEWDISFPPNTVRATKASFTLKKDPGGQSVLSLGSDWIDLTSGQAVGRQDNIPAGAYFLDLYLGADFAYVSTHRVVSIKKDETSSLNLQFTTDEFIAYTLLNVKFTLKSEVPLTPDLTKITFHEAVDCADSAFMSYNGGTDERSVSTNSLTTEYESIAWTAVPNNLGDSTNFKSEFYAKMFVRDTNGRVFKRISGPHTVEGQQPAAFDISFTTPLLQPAVIENPNPANGTANFVQNDALGNTFNSASYSGCDPLTDVTVYTTGNNCFLKNISVKNNSGGDPLSSPLSELSANMSNQQENFEFLMPNMPVKIKVEWYSNFSMLAAERAAQTSNNSISYLRYATLQEAIDAVQVQTTETIRVLNDLTANGSASGGFSSSNSTISISDKSVTLSVKKDVSAVIKRAAVFTTVAFFAVSSNGSLTLKGDGNGKLILDGGAVWSGGTGSPPSPANGASNVGVSGSSNLVQLIGTLTMNGGAVLQNNDGADTVVLSGGTFNMSGGEIIRNSFDWGVVHVLSGGIFNMSDGTISGNEGRSGGVCVSGASGSYGTFNMSGGTISGNSATDQDYGGGVLISGDNNPSGGTFDMSGGTISGNTASCGIGKGVFLNTGTFKISGSAKVDANNDVYLLGTNTINISNPLNGSAVATITPSVYTAGKPVLSGTYVLISYNKFAVTQPVPSSTPWVIDSGGKLAEAQKLAVLELGNGGGTFDFYEGLTYTAYSNERCSLSNVLPMAVYFATSGTQASPDKIKLKGGETYTPTSTVNIGTGGYGADRYIEISSLSGIATIKKPSGANLFNITSKGRLTLGGGDSSKLLHLKGNSGAYALVVIEQGSSNSKLTIQDGAKLEGNTAYSALLVNGEAVMTGGEISGNTYSGTNGNGGGVYVNSGTFTMTGGGILVNTSNNGGGVYVNGGTFTMAGGKINENISNYGGGVSINNGSTFIMSGGEISENSVNSNGNGGGVNVYNGSFTMSGGTISLNYAKSGGGVYVTSSGTFSKTGGTIYGTDDPLTNAASNDDNGPAAYIYRSISDIKKRIDTAGPSINLDSGTNDNWQ